MSDSIYVIRTESEGMKTDRMEMTVVIYERVDCVRDHDFSTETNTNQPQRTGEYIRFCFVFVFLSKNIRYCFMDNH